MRGLASFSPFPPLRLRASAPLREKIIRMSADRCMNLSVSSVVMNGPPAGGANGYELLDKSVFVQLQVREALIRLGYAEKFKTVTHQIVA